MINCTDFLAEIGNYLEDDLAVELRAQLERHLSHCRSCKVLLDSTQKTIKIVTDTDTFDVSDVEFKPMVSGIMDKIRSSGPSGA